MCSGLVKYKANVWGVSKERARRILDDYAKRFDRPSPGAFRKKKMEVKRYENQNTQLSKSC